MAHHATRIINSRSSLREFRQQVAAIIFHAADPEQEQTRTFICRICRHTNQLCTCQQKRGVA